MVYILLCPYLWWEIAIWSQSLGNEPFSSDFEKFFITAFLYFFRKTFEPWIPPPILSIYLIFSFMFHVSIPAITEGIFIHKGRVIAWQREFLGLFQVRNVNIIWFGPIYDEHSTLVLDLIEWVFRNRRSFLFLLSFFYCIRGAVKCVDWPSDLRPYKPLSSWDMPTKPVTIVIGMVDPAIAPPFESSTQTQGTSQ